MLIIIIDRRILIRCWAVLLR